MYTSLEPELVSLGNGYDILVCRTLCMHLALQSTLQGNVSILYFNLFNFIINV